jgi:hypothetical protein
MRPLSLSLTLYSVLCFMRCGSWQPAMSIGTVYRTRIAKEKQLLTVDSLNIPFIDDAKYM